MRLKLVPLIMLPSLLLGGCYVRLPISRALAEPLSDSEVRTLHERGERPSTPGEWFRVRAILPRETVRKIARWELYTHIRVEDCRTGELVGIASSAEIEGTAGDFHRIREQLRADQQRQAFIMTEPVFFPAGRPLDQPCLRLEGGSYTLQKISSERVPLQLRRRHA